MSMTMIIIISLLVLNLSLTLIMFWILHSVLEETKSLQESNDIVNHVFEVCREAIENYGKGLTRVHERESALNEAFESGTKCLTNSYDNILKAYEIMRKQYDSIIDMNKKLLECWKGCEERYSQSYELFKHCSDNLKEVSFQLTDLANMSTEDEYSLTLQDACDTVCLECPYDDLTGRYKCKNCPVHEVMHRNDIPDGIEGETPVDQEAMEEFFETDCFKDIREKGGDS